MKLPESKTAPSAFRYQQQHHRSTTAFKCVNDTNNVGMPALDASEDTSKSIDETLNLDEMVRYL